MQRCCPETCGTGALDEAACNALEGSGVCIYPTAAQPDCSETTQTPETTENATTKTPSAASTIPVDTTADTTAPPTDTSTETTTDSCVPRDVDACLHESPDWNHDYTCASSVGWCESWPKDMQRCCPETCGTGALDEAACNALEGSGVCIYPTAAQPDCSETTQTPETTENATTKTPSAASTIPVDTTAVCTPYSAEACRAAAQRLGLEEGGAGHAFEGDYSQKGCYAYSSGEYANRAYYGLGGSDSEISSPNTNSDETYRPEGYDCVVVTTEKPETTEGETTKTPSAASTQKPETTEAATTKTPSAATTLAPETTQAATTKSPSVATSLEPETTEAATTKTPSAAMTLAPESTEPVEVTCVLPSIAVGYYWFPFAVLTGCTSLDCNNPSAGGPLTCDSASGYYGLPQIIGCTARDPVVTFTGCVRPPTKAPSRPPADVTSKPTKNPVASYPTHNPISSHPTRDPITTHPSRSPEASFPSESPESTYPSRNPISSHPTHSPLPQSPTKSPDSSHPTRPPVTTHPTHKPVAAAPTKDPVTKHPSHSPLTEDPSRMPIPAHPSRSPLESPKYVNSPSNNPISAYPSRNPVTEHPSRNPISSTPSTSPESKHPTLSPQTTQPSRKPVTTYPTKNPVSSHPTKYPQSDVPTRTPISTHPTKSPESTHPTRPPVSAAPTRNPITKFPSKSPIATHPSRNPISSQPSRHPGYAKPTNSPIFTKPSNHPIHVKVREELTFDNDYDEFFPSSDAITQFLEECTAELKIKTPTMECTKVAKGSIIVTVEGSESDMAVTKARVSTIGLDLPSYDLMMPPTDAAAITGGDTTSTDDNKFEIFGQEMKEGTFMFIVGAIAVVYICVFGLCVWFCRATKPVIYRMDDDMRVENDLEMMETITAVESFESKLVDQKTTKAEPEVLSWIPTEPKPTKRSPDISSYAAKDPNIQEEPTPVTAGGFEVWGGSIQERGDFGRAQLFSDDWTSEETAVPGEGATADTGGANIATDDNDHEGLDIYGRHAMPEH